MDQSKPQVHSRPTTCKKHAFCYGGWGGMGGGGTSQHILTFKKVHFYSTKHNSIKYNYILKIKIVFNIFNNNDNVNKVSISSTWEMMIMIQPFNIVKNNDKIDKKVVRFICDIFLNYPFGYFYDVCDMDLFCNTYITLYHPTGQSCFKVKYS